jgi:hypothetical protein
VAWSDTRESARALAEANSLIEKAVRTEVLLVDTDEARDCTQAPEMDIAPPLPVRKQRAGRHAGKWRASDLGGYS